MRIQHLLLIGALTAAGSVMPRAAASSNGSTDSGKSAALYNGPHTQVAMWIWTDKYVYQPGQTATLKWTVKPNGDLYPYTVVAYRQNNQTGAKTYLPDGGATVTDIHGNTLAEGFEPAPLAAATKANIGSALAIPNETGMHTFAVELRDYTGTRILKTSYMKIGVVSGKADLTGDITADRTLTNDTEWDLKGVVKVKNGATLTIQPGTFIIGQPGSQPPSALLVTREGKIMAAGTKSRPIIMTSSLPFGQRNRGDWGGLIMLGKAPINVGANSGGTDNPAGSFYIEGLSATPDGLYGGTDPNHSCGTLQYVRVEFAGSILSQANEVNAITWGGCGKATVADHLQASYGLDDSFEWFGGDMDAKYLVGGLGRDDYLDFQLGYTGRIQYGLFFQSPNLPGNRGIEGDNSEFVQTAEPFSSPTIYNATFVGSGIPGFDETSSPGIFLRRGARGSFNNIVVTNFYSGAVDISDENTQAQADAGKLTMNGILMWNNNIGTQGAATLQGQITSEYTRAYAQGQKGNGAGKNFTVADPKLTRINEYSDMDFMPQFGSPVFQAGWIAPPDDGFFDQSARFVGGMGDYNWTEEWTNFLVDTDVAP